MSLVSFEQNNFTRWNVYFVPWAKQNPKQKMKTFCCNLLGICNQIWKQYSLPYNSLECSEILESFEIKLHFKVLTCIFNPTSCNFCRLCFVSTGGENGVPREAPQWLGPALVQIFLETHHFRHSHQHQTSGRAGKTSHHHQVSPSQNGQLLSFIKFEDSIIILHPNFFFFFFFFFNKWLLFSGKFILFSCI